MSDLADSTQVALLMSQILTNYTQMMVNFFDMFYNPNPMDLTLEMYNDEGEIDTYTVPNRAKDRAYILNGNGSPEGAIHADRGSIYQDLTNGTLYVKTDDSLNSGWKEFINKAILDSILKKDNGSPEGIRSGELGELYLDRSTAQLYIKTTQSGNTGWSPFLRDDDNLYVKVAAYQTVTNKTMDASENNFINFTKANFTSEAITDILSAPFAVNRGSVNAQGEPNYVYYPFAELNNGCTISGSTITGAKNAYFVKDQTANFQNFTTWEMQITYTFGGGGTYPTIIGHALDASTYNMPRLYLENGVLKFQASSNGTSWDIADDLTMLNMVSGTTYNLVIKYDSETGYTINNGSTQVYSNSNTAKIKGKEGLMLLNDGTDLATYYSSGSINFSTLKFYANNSILINGADFDKIQTRSGEGYEKLIVSNGDADTYEFDSIKTLVVSTLQNETYNIFLDMDTKQLYATSNSVYAGKVPPANMSNGDIYVRQITPMEVYMKTSSGFVEFTDAWMGSFQKSNGTVTTVTPNQFNSNYMHVDLANVATTVRRSENASDYVVPTEKAVATAIETYNDSGVVVLGNVSNTVTLTKDKMHTATFVTSGTIALPDSSLLEADTHYNCSIIFNYLTNATVTQPTVTWSYGVAPLLSSTTAKYRVTYETVNQGATWYGYWTQLGV